MAGTDANGDVEWTEAYTPYGISFVNNAANDNQAGFTGHIKDSDTGLTYMQARYYDLVVGRFLSHDLVQFSVEQSLHFNRYGYTYNNPVNMTDPDGNIPIIAAAIKTAECAFKSACRVAVSAGIGAGVGGTVALVTGIVNPNVELSFSSVATGAAKGAAAGGVLAKTGSVKKAAATVAGMGVVEGALRSDGYQKDGAMEKFLEIGKDAVVQGVSDYVTTTIGAGIGRHFAEEFGEAFAKSFGATIGAGALNGANSLNEVGGKTTPQHGTLEEQWERFTNPLLDMPRYNDDEQKLRK